MVQGEQRRHPRHHVHLHVVVTPPPPPESSSSIEEIPELPVTAVVDLSESGAGLDWSLPADIGIGAEVRLRFLLAGSQTIDVEGIVVRVGSGRAGVEFLPAARAIVRQLLAESRSD